MGQKEKQIQKITPAETPVGGGRPEQTKSREFQSRKQQQQKANTMWRKQKQEMQPNPSQQQHIYGFVPFKSAAIAPSHKTHSTHGISDCSSPYGTSINPCAVPNAASAAGDYMHSIYAPPRLIHQHNRPESALNCLNGKNKHRNQGLLFGSRPVSDMGIYKLTPSRCQSYTTLPRPEHAVPEMVADEQFLAPFASPNTNQQQQNYGIRREDGNNLSMPFRSPSALSGSRSLGRKNSTATSLPPAYFAPNSNAFFNSSQTDFGIGLNEGEHNEQGFQRQEMTPWSTISLASWLTIVFGSAIFCLSAVRLYWRADIVKGSQELFYGTSAICAGIVGVLATQHRSYCMLVATFVHFSINIVFFVPFISGILPLIPFISSSAASFGITSKQSPLLNLGGAMNNAKELPVLAGAMVMLSLFQLAAAFSLLLYGCRTFGRTMRHVENIQRGINALQSQQNPGGEIGEQEKDAGGEMRRKL
ncbi:hypothetical protein niasHT_015898 [Heterodera trifolii]|uniref:Uncharacterized protein n=1 Tax=Heterodera trifolii TaxID=157864 RepID=A0ABD2LK05_9BILA